MPRSSALIVAIISLAAAVTPVTTVALKTLVARVAVVAALAIARSTVAVGSVQPGAIISPVTLFLRSTVPACLILQTLSIAGIQDAVQSPNHVIHALGGTRTSAGHRRQQSD
jgi:hypothetical protein